MIRVYSAAEIIEIKWSMGRMSVCLYICKTNNKMDQYCAKMRKLWSLLNLRTYISGFKSEYTGCCEHLVGLSRQKEIRDGHTDEIAQLAFIRL